MLSVIGSRIRANIENGYIRKGAVSGACHGVAVGGPKPEAAFINRIPLILLPDRSYVLRTMHSIKDESLRSSFCISECSWPGKRHLDHKRGCPDTKPFVSTLEPKSLAFKPLQ